jgi:hypothetical protein
VEFSGILFSIFIIDIVAKIDFCRFHMYADDLQLYLSDDPCSLDECIRSMNADLDRLYIGLCLNPEKFSRNSCGDGSAGVNGGCNDTMVE